MTIFENEFIKVNTTDKDYDFIAVIENKTNEQICIHYDEPGYNDNYDPILIAPNDWAGLLADEEGRNWVKAIENNQIYVVTNDDEIGYYPTGCSIKDQISHGRMKKMTKTIYEENFETDYNPSDVDWIIDSNEDEHDEDGNLILDHKAAFNFQVGDVIIIGFLDGFGDISRAEKFKIIKNDCEHLVCKSVE